MKRLQLNGMSKYFPGVKALDGVSFDLYEGEVHALCGENGAGKSTLMNVLAGNLQPDGGEILLNNQKISIPSPQHANALGIAIVYQQLSLVNNLSVAENIFANQPPRTTWGLINFRALHTQTQGLLTRLKIRNVNPQTRVDALSAGQKQLVEIAKALAKNPDILILDEPTASITATETETLFDIIRQLKREGVSIIYISHRMLEIFDIADRITVLKDGRYQGTQLTGDTTVRALIQQMVGRDLEELTAHSSRQAAVLLEVKHLSGQQFRDVSFQLHRGEILAMAGLVGAGRTEIAQAIFGVGTITGGEVMLKGRYIRVKHPQDAMEAGIGYVPEERKTLGLFMDMTVADNIVAANLSDTKVGRFFNAAKIGTIAGQYRQKLRVATPDVWQKVWSLSGGNQQKVVLAKWLFRNPDVLIVDEPTHGVDVGAKYEIYQLLKQLAAEGKGILLISSELSEVLTISDRVLVIKDGTITGELDTRQTTEEEIITLATT